MGRFIEPLEVRVEPNGVTRTLTHEITYFDDDGAGYTVPAGFKTDFASTPRAVWWLCPPSTGKYVYGAVCHDFWYRTADVEMTRLRADELFLEIMKNSGVGVIKRNAMYKAVRLFGGLSFVKRK